jgi:hypothetical protein
MSTGQNFLSAMDRIAQVRKKVREFRAFKEEEFVKEMEGYKLQGVSNTQEPGLPSGQRMNLRRYYNETLVLIPERLSSEKPADAKALLELPRWPSAMRVSYSSYTLGLDFLSTNGTLWKMLKRPDPSGVTLSSSQGMCAVLALSEPGFAPLFVTSNLGLSESASDAADWLVLYDDPALQRTPSSAPRVSPSGSEVAVFIVLASSFPSALRQEEAGKKTKGAGVAVHSSSNALMEVMRCLVNGQWKSVDSTISGIKFLCAKLSAAGAEATSPLHRAESGASTGHGNSGFGAISLCPTVEAFGDSKQMPKWTLLQEKNDPGLAGKDHNLNTIFSQLQV